MMNMTPVVKQLIIINVIFFIGSQLVPISYEYLAMFFPESPNFMLWQPVTHMFMHGDILHIISNMFVLISFGSTLEMAFGPKKILFFYISCGLGAVLFDTAIKYYMFQDGLNSLITAGFSKSNVLNLLSEGKIDERWQDILTATEYRNFTGSYFGASLGASGATYGLMIAFAFMFPNVELGLIFIPIPIKAKYFVLGILTIDLVLGLKNNSLFGGGSGHLIGHFAHLGGALTGYLMMLYWKKNQFNNNRWN
ncbi:rhomboid family intramembrane serine protease [Flavobacterium cheongpyeongense]|uniref:Rhomboid family intramembrane serine protease n=1 Tax=Flavobacterium cheongpyeongense TaxID=2212651 RepID=A0A2V4BMW1_9FLAO|nr:rhomboid family intramembrane serine protease [Flavobacterium cheongpyeongense]PXY39862.1 rhomboid family intramembrane serine protease [Flavobacterium cheongpyeongense]